MKTEADCVDPLVQSIDDARQARRMTWERLSVRSGVTMGTIKSWLYRGSSPRLADARDCLSALGYALDLSVNQTKQWVRT